MLLAMINQHCFKKWHQDISWSNDDKNLCRLEATLDVHDLTKVDQGLSLNPEIFQIALKSTVKGSYMCTRLKKNSSVNRNTAGFRAILDLEQFQD